MTIATYVLVGIVILAIIVSLIVGQVRKHQKTPAEKTRDNRDEIEMNANRVDALLVLAGGDSAVSGELVDLKESLKYLQPSDKKEVVEYDNKIKNAIGDLKILLSKPVKDSDRRDSEVLGSIQDIRVLTAERNARI